MNQFSYSLIGYLLLPLMLLRLLIKSIKAPEYRKRMGERLGFINKIPVPIIWIHCVSVGEFRASITLIDQLIKNYPEHRVLITSTTPTGSRAIKNHYQQQVLHYYFPFDLGFVVNRYVAKTNAKICILLETEIWPNLVRALDKNNVPTLLINARLSQRSLEKYQKFAPNLAKQTLNKFSVIAAQNKNSQQRFIELGTLPNKAINAGNIKFDQKVTINQDTSQSLKTMIGKRKVVVFASTHDTEELQIINAYLAVKDAIDALLVIIPRHPERFKEVYKLAQKNNLSIVRRSSNKSAQTAQILLGDSMGEMMNYFSVADIVFMGGSLNNTGGHNMLEPAALSKPILFGPAVFNFAEISFDLVNNKGAIQVKNSNELFECIIELCADVKQRKKLGDNAYQYFKSKQGALKTILQLIDQSL